MILPPFFYQIFESLPRQGPGTSGATKHVFSLIPPLSDNAKILDVGCGSGTQTLDLAGQTTGTITAVDNHQPFLDQLNARAKKAGLQGRIRTMNASMDALPFEPGQFDLVWSEGAIFIVGFEQGLSLWMPFLSSRASSTLYGPKGRSSLSGSSRGSPSGSPS